MNYIIYGTSYNLIDREIKSIVKNNSYNVFSLLDTSLKDIMEDLNYSSLFEDKKIVIIKNFENAIESKKNNQSELDELKNYLMNPNENTTLILVSSVKMNDRAKANKEFLSYLNIIETPIINKSYELANILNEIIKSEGYLIYTNALNLFVLKCASNIDIAIMEFNKLKSIKGKARTITESDIEEFVSNYNVSDIFDFKDAVINKNITKSMRMIDDLENSKAEIVPIVVMLAKEFQTLYNIAVLANNKKNNDEISRCLGNMHPYRVKILRESSRKYKLDELKRHILYLCNLNLRLVSQDNLGFDEIRRFLIDL